MKEIYDVGVVFRGFILVNNIFKELPKQMEKDNQKDLRGAFISAITTFTQAIFNNNYLEYLESGDILFLFKMAEIKSSDSNIKEPIILYCLTRKTTKNSEKDMKKFREKAELILQAFIIKYNNYNFTDISQFENFKDELTRYFIKK